MQQWVNLTGRWTLWTREWIFGLDVLGGNSYQDGRSADRLPWQYLSHRFPASLGPITPPPLTLILNQRSLTAFNLENSIALFIHTHTYTHTERERGWLSLTMPLRKASTVLGRTLPLRSECPFGVAAAGGIVSLVPLRNTSGLHMPVRDRSQGIDFLGGFCKFIQCTLSFIPLYFLVSKVRISILICRRNYDRCTARVLLVKERRNSSTGRKELVQG